MSRYSSERMPEDELLDTIDDLVGGERKTVVNCWLCDNPLQDETKMFHALCLWDSMRKLANRRMKPVKVGS